MSRHRWAIDMPSIARKGGEAFPLAEGPTGHMCRSCGRKIARHEWSPGAFSACSRRCLARLADGLTWIAEAVKARHGVDLDG